MPHVGLPHCPTLVTPLPPIGCPIAPHWVAHLTLHVGFSRCSSRWVLPTALHLRTFWCGEDGGLRVAVGPLPKLKSFSTSAAVRLLCATVVGRGADVWRADGGGGGGLLFGVGFQGMKPKNSPGRGAWGEMSPHRGQMGVRCGEILHPEAVRPQHCCPELWVPHPWRCPRPWVGPGQPELGGSQPTAGVGLGGSLLTQLWLCYCGL